MLFRSADGSLAPLDQGEQQIESARPHGSGLHRKHDLAGQAVDRKTIDVKLVLGRGFNGCRFDQLMSQGFGRGRTATMAAADFQTSWRRADGAAPVLRSRSRVRQTMAYWGVLFAIKAQMLRCRLPLRRRRPHCANQPETSPASRPRCVGAAFAITWAKSRCR